MGRILYVSKPIAPPWHDSGKNLVRDLISGLVRHDVTVMVPNGTQLGFERAHAEAIYPARKGAYAPALLDNARVLRRLLLGRRASLFHFFFAPNPRTSSVGRLVTKARRTPSIHTIASAPHVSVDPRAVLFADINVVLSQHTQQRLLNAGVDAARITRIAPAVPHIDPQSLMSREQVFDKLSIPRDAQMILYPGDLEFGGGAELVVDAALADTDANHVWVFACRAKTPRAVDALTRLRERVASQRAEKKFRWLGETSDILSIVGASDLVTLPATDLYAKMDYPLVLLEAMMLARPILVASGTPSEEIAPHGGAVIEPNVDALLAAASSLLADTEVGARGQAFARTLSPRAMAEQYESLYDRLLK